MGIKIRQIGNIREELKKQKDNKSSGTRANFATWIPHKDDAELRCRFLADPDNNGWLGYDQFYVPGKGVVVATDDNWDYYTEEKNMWPSRRFYAPILDFESNEVKVLEVPNSIVEDILLLGDRWGGDSKTLTAFDVALYKTGYQKDTTYHVEFVGAKELDLSIYEVPDLEASLQAKIDWQEGKSKKEEDASDELEDEVVETASSDDEPPFVPDPPKKTITRKRTIKRK